MTPEKYCNITYDKSIDSWDDGLPLGNGQIGCLIWGNSSALRLSIDKSGLWDCSGAPEPGGDFIYEAMKSFVEKGKQNKIVKVFDRPYAKPVPTKLPAGKIIIKLSNSLEMKSELSLVTASAGITMDETKLKCFIHAEKPIGFIRLNRTDCEIAIENPQYGTKGLSSHMRNFFQKAAITQSLKNVSYDAAQKNTRQNGQITFRYFTQKVNEKLTYGIFIGEKRDAYGLAAAFTVISAESRQLAEQQAFKLLSSALEEGYDSNFASHTKWWAAFWNESSMRLPDKFFEKQWYLTNYLLASCSRGGSDPMPLQGVWTADNGQLPPWKGDYHLDLNVQLCYLSYLKANHFSCGKSYLDFLFSLKNTAEKFAKEFYKADGLCLPSVLDKEGHALGGWPMYALSPTNQAWVCHGIKQYFDYTRDMDFLRNKAYPYMKQYGLFLRSLLKEDGDGFLVLPLSSSPETHSNSLKAWLTPNSNYDCAMLRRHFMSLLEFSESLGYVGDSELWRGLLNKIAPLTIDSDQVLMLSPNERQTESHRHFSHLIAIYPLKLLHYSGDDRDVIDASIANLEKLGTREYCGYSFAWLADLYCVQKRGDKAFEALNTFWRCFCLDNGFHVNGDYKKTGKSKFQYRVFTLEGNFCAADALQEMLLYAHDNTVEICPATPNDWKDLSFSLCAENGVMVSAELYAGQLKQVTLTTPRDIKIKLLYHKYEWDIQLQAGKETVLSEALLSDLS